MISAFQLYKYLCLTVGKQNLFGSFMQYSHKLQNVSN